VNAAVQPQPEAEIVIRLTIPAAETLLEGLSKLPIDRAYSLYKGLREATDDALQLQRAPQSPAPAPPTPPNSDDKSTQETQQT
jgi:hypothetical protein